jgi:hypothetical protein
MANDDELLAALDELVAALHQNNARNAEAIARAEEIKRERAAGRAWSEIVSGERPLIVELLTRNLEALTTYGSRLRRLEARALHDEGLSMERIGALFGVTRQRISELLRQPQKGGRRVS